MAQPVMIAGMHRSGTSMITRLLNLAGVQLGPTQDLLQAMPDNPTGYWESRSLMMVNDELLNLFGGAWDHPPELPVGFELDPRAQALLEQAAQALEPLQTAGGNAWGWKDPRNSITFAFWRQLVPDAKMVLCLRNPLEVHSSLRARGGYSTAHFSMHLWRTYNRAALAATQASERVVTHYDSYFIDAPRELERVLGELGLPSSPEMAMVASSHLRTDLRHDRRSLADLEDESAVTEEDLDLYEQLCREAGPIYAAAHGV